MIFNPPQSELLIVALLVTLSGPFHKNLHIIVSINDINSEEGERIENIYTNLERRRLLMIDTLPNKERPLQLHWRIFFYFGYLIIKVFLETIFCHSWTVPQELVCIYTILEIRVSWGCHNTNQSNNNNTHFITHLDITMN